MSKFDWKAAVGVVAPAIATALGGPLAGAAVSALGRAILGDDKATEAQVAEAIKTASPEVWAGVRKADQAFEVQMKELGFKLDELVYKDIDSARQREIATKDWTPRALAIGVTLGFFGILIYLIQNGVPPEGGDALLVMLGALGGAWASIVTYYFGSSAGSREKTALLGNSK